MYHHNDYYHTLHLFGYGQAGGEPVRDYRMTIIKFSGNLFCPVLEVRCLYSELVPYYRAAVLVVINFKP